MALVLLGSELNTTRSCMFFANQKMGANGGRDKDGCGMAIHCTQCVPHYIGIYIGI